MRGRAETTGERRRTGAPGCLNPARPFAARAGAAASPLGEEPCDTYARLKAAYGFLILLSIYFYIYQEAFLLLPSYCQGRIVDVV